MISASTAGAVFLAHEKQETEQPAPIAESHATAKLFEVAANHDGQPPLQWLMMLRELFGSQQ